ncbi:hypothetical protein C6T58_16735 [Burkholderia multivorans]|nr:hypothetical protein C6Q11_30540 [Burkholderia multivorans]PRG80169.1 hypothetical protein C6T58_16735 [Burkholderia multivorans]
MPRPRTTSFQHEPPLILRGDKTDRNGVVVADIGNTVFRGQRYDSSIDPPASPPLVASIIPRHSRRDAPAAAPRITKKPPTKPAPTHRQTAPPRHRHHAACRGRTARSGTS